MRQAPLLLALLLAALLLTSCSLLGVYDGQCCAFNPPGPPTPDGSTTLSVYGPGGIRVGSATSSGPSTFVFTGTGGGRRGR